MPAWTIEQVQPNSHIIRFTLSPATRQYVLLTSDRHHDNLHSRWDLEKRHLDKAAELDALVLDVGDLFCAMQGKFDPRSAMDDLRPEHKTAKYLDALVETAHDFYKPYADLFALIARGNHETNIHKRHGTDLTDRLVSDLRRERGARVQAGQYAGWVQFRIVVHKTVRTTKTLHYHHGYGNGGPVTRDVISTNRMAVNYPDADILVSGHTHDSWVMPIKRHRLSLDGKPFDDIAWHIKAGTYKDEQTTGNGFAVEKGHNPKPLGCVWLEFGYEQERVVINARPEVE